MSNTALVTDAAETAAQDTLQDYSNGVVGHTGGDWGGHLQMNVADTVFSSGAGIITVHQLRMLLTDGSIDRPVVVPAILLNTAPATVPPSIIQQPVSLTVHQNSPATFKVFAASPSPLVYQWFHNGNLILNANSNSYTIISAKLSDNGNYVVAVANGAGTVSSAVVTLTVTFP